MVAAGLRGTPGAWIATGAVSIILWTEITLASALLNALATIQIGPIRMSVQTFGKEIIVVGPFRPGCSVMHVRTLVSLPIGIHPEGKSKIQDLTSDETKTRKLARGSNML